MNNDRWRHDDDEDEEDVPRRSFFKKARAIVVGGVVGLFPALGALGFLCSPLVMRDGGIVGKEKGYLPLKIGPNALPDDGTPQSFKIVADVVDAWNFYPQQEVGSVWLRKTPAGKIIAFNTICPHLGCSVDYRGAQAAFFCPCHFVVDGRLWVEYKNYRGGIEKQVEV